MRGLKQPGVCRIFFSSPFNGLEGEREELTRQYWPRLDAACKQRGLQFVAVDMRWGITAEMSSDNQTINVCLGEIDRSDLFVGFFGQRYGWHGEKDEALQKTFDAALSSFPWIDESRDRSITELEFLHGHLRAPGELPAVICFRDAKWDNARAAEAKERGDKRGIYKYSSESEVATERMRDLKKRVKDTEQQCIAINMSYSTPEEGAKFMFDNIWKYLSEELFKEDDTRSEQEQAIADHAAFMAAKISYYVPSETMLRDLEPHIKKEDDSPRVLLVTGPGGCGKTSLLAHWLRTQEKKQASDTTIVYHFVGCSAESTLVRNLLLRVLSGLHFGLESSSVADKSSLWRELHKRFSGLNDSELAPLVNEVMHRYEKAGRTAIVVIVGIDKINYAGMEKNAEPLFWLPQSLPRGCHVILSTGHDDNRHLEALKLRTQFSTLEVQSLTRDQQQSMIQRALELRGKTLSEPQAERIVSAEGPSNPLFLNVVLEELVMFGRFRELDAKIESLVTCKDSVELFGKYLERLEKDYNSEDYKGNLVQQVACALAVSGRGLSETELMDMLHIPHSLWPPLYFGLKKYIISNQGFLRLAHKELEGAITKRYIPNEKEKKEYIGVQRKYYMDTLKSYEGVTLPQHLLGALLWSAHACEHVLTLLQVLTTPAYFAHLITPAHIAYTYEYLQLLRYSEAKLVELYHEQFTKYMVKDYNAQLEDLIDKPNVIPELLKNLWNLQYFLRFCQYLEAQKLNLKHIQQILEKTTKLCVEALFQQKLDVNVRLAQVCIENMETEDTIKYSQNVLNLVDKKYGTEVPPEEVVTNIGTAYHTIGLAHKSLGNYQQAEECVQKSIETHKNNHHNVETERDLRQSRSLLAEIKWESGQFAEAAKMFEQIVKEEEAASVGSLSISVSHKLTSLSICYRRLEEYDKAQGCLDKAMAIKKAVQGGNHRDVAIGYFNNANLAKDREDLPEMIRCLDEAIRILKFRGDTITSNHMMFLCYDNKMIALIFSERFQDAFEIYWENFEVIKTKFDLCVGFIHENIFRYCIRANKLTEAVLILKELIRSKHVQPDHYLILQGLVTGENKAEVDISDEDLSVKSGFEKFSASAELLQAYIQINLAPARDKDAILKALDVLASQPGAQISRAVCLAAGGCAEWPEGAAHLLQHWLERMPEAEDIVRELAVVYYKLEDYVRSTECFRRAVELNPSEPILQDKYVMLLVMRGLTEEANKELEILNSRFGSDPNIAQTVEKYRAILKQIAEEKEKT